MPRAFDLLDRRRSPWSSSRRCCWSPRSRSGSAAAARSIYRQRRVGLDGARVRDAEAADDGRRAPTRSGSAPSSPATTRGSPAPAASCAAPRSTRSPTWSTSCAARWRSSARARRSRPRSTTTRPRQHRRHEVRPGITGWAQVQGRAGIPWEERIELDVWYVDHRSAALDLRILAKTAWLLVTGHGPRARLSAG